MMLCWWAGIMSAIAGSGEQVICSYKVVGDLLEIDFNEGTEALLERKVWEEGRPKSRFIQETHVLWRVPKLEEVLEREDDWLLFNESTMTIVAHLPPADQESLADLLREEFGFPKLVQLELRLLRVAARGLETMTWTEDQVKEKSPKELFHQTLTCRVGLRAQTRIEGESGGLLLRAECQVRGEDELLELFLRLKWETEGLPVIEQMTASAFRLGQKSYVNLGSLEEDKILLLEIDPRLVFADLSPCSEWWQWEEGAPERQTPNRESNEWQERWWLYPSENFGDLLHSEDGELKVEEVTLESDHNGLQAGTVVWDLMPILAEADVKISEGGWVFFAPESSTLVARLRDDEVEGLEFWLGIDSSHLELPRIDVLMSVITFRGSVKSGQVPRRFRRLAQLGVSARPGQRWVGSLASGTRKFSIRMDANVGVSEKLIEIRYHLEFEDEESLEMTHPVIVTSGTPMVLPLKKEGGVVTALIIDATFTRISSGSRKE